MANHDIAAAILSSLCLIHCLALPLAITMLPALSLLVPHAPWLHAVLLVLAIPFSGTALLRGWRSHGDHRPMIVGAGGIAIMAAALLAPVHSVEDMMTVAGGLIVAAGHVLNIRSGRRRILPNAGVTA